MSERNGSFQADDWFQGDPVEPDLMSSEARRILELVFFVALSGVISFLGSVGNIINITVFFKQGLTDSVNISLLGLALSDLGSHLTLVWMSICFNPLFRYSNISFESIDVQYLSAGWPHVCFARITSWITAFITFERCLCIALPLKVKQIINPRRTVIVVVVIFLVMLVSVMPVYYAIYIGPSYHASRNMSLAGLLYARGGPAVENVSFSITVFAQLSSFVLVILCTAVLIVNMVEKSRWRRSVTAVAVASSESMSGRDKRVVKMVLFLSCIFIACFMPSAVNLILMLRFSPDYSIVGPYQNSFQVSWSILNTLEATNSTVSIIVYYNMSTRFRLVFREIFCRGKS
ncbi:hypothetical protein Btru_025579 [Bulinus truncatus]|nr:hypothetical protein Btru_025579 [Bulinus truncatus]